MDRCYRGNGRLQCHGKARFWVVLRHRLGTVRAVSLNRCEQLLFDYIGKHPEERQFWLHKVQAVAKARASEGDTAERLELELWSYFKERASVVPALKEFARTQGLARTSMRNLAEYLMRLWAPERPKRPKPEGFDLG